ncbi:MAG: hypothetical protein II730_11295, partial [Bacteroidales bacterium]|nr:hypothetical protein [Bacteroidales bacterium]
MDYGRFAFVYVFAELIFHFAGFSNMRPTGSSEQLFLYLCKHKTGEPDRSTLQIITMMKKHFTTAAGLLILSVMMMPSSFADG